MADPMVVGMGGSTVEVMAGFTAVVIFMETISMEVRASSSGVSSGSPTTIRTVIILTPITIIPITIRTLIKIPITPMLVPRLQYTANRGLRTTTITPAEL